MEKNNEYVGNSNMNIFLLILRGTRETSAEGKEN